MASIGLENGSIGPLLRAGIGSLVNVATSYPTMDEYFNRKQLAKTSVVKYKSSFDLIRKVVDYEKDDIGFLNRVKTFERNIMKYDYSMNTIKSVYICWYSLAKEFPEYCYKRTLVDLKEKMDEFNHKSAEEMAKNKPSDSDVMSLADLREMISSMPNTTFDEYLSKIIVALYCYLPPIRLDYAEMLVYSREYKNKMNEVNYCVFNKNGFYFVLNHFKTKRSIGRFQSLFVPPSSPLWHYLKFWFENFNTKKQWLLCSSDNVPLSRSALAKRLKTAIKTYAGKDIGIRQLRRIYETEMITSVEYAALTLEQKKEAHRQLLHSFEMGHAYAIHDRDDTSSEGE